MRTRTSSLWYAKLQRVQSFADAKSVVDAALLKGNRQELLGFLAELYEEYVGPDPRGGEVGTLEHMRKLFEGISPRPSGEELIQFEVNLRDLQSYFAHL